MKRKVLLSFLGTGSYIPCKYVKNNTKSDLVSYIQEAMVQLFHLDDNPQNKIYVFLTEGAKEANWENETGLKNKLQKRVKNSQLEGISIPEGKSEDEIWEIFSIINDYIQEDDSIILDITHSFRFLPTFSTVLLNYTRVLKNTSIESICYGAFESLGKPHEIENIDPEKREIPVFDLKSFDVLQRWNAAADSFITYGDGLKLTKLLKEEIKRQQLHNEEYTNALKDLMENIEKMTAYLATVRAKDIYEGYVFMQIVNTIDSLMKSQCKLEALTPILSKIKKRVEQFKPDNVMNGFYAVELCIESNMIQQGLTLLQEFIKAYFIDKYLGKDGIKEYKRNQDIVTQAFHGKYDNSIMRNQEDNKLHADVIQDNLMLNIINHYRQISKIRNDINHAGSFIKESKDFTKKLRKLYNKLIHHINLDNQGEMKH